MQLNLTLHGPMWPRVLPFALYILVLGIGPALAHGFPDVRWVYPLQAGLALAALLIFQRSYTELRAPAPSLRELGIGALVGALVFVAWIHLDVPYLAFEGSKGFDPRHADGRLNLGWALVRLAGAALVVPIMEELFWRSFVLRWIARPEFATLHPATAGLRGLAISSIVFGLEHSLWFAGILAGLAYGALYMWRGKLWTPIVSHAVTNFLLGVWVLTTGNWQFW